MTDKSSIRELHIEWLRHAAIISRPSHEDRRRHGWEIARRAADMLREKYGVKRVRVFGSLLHPSHFDSRSDIDLGVEGLSVANYWAAVAELYFFDKEIAIELVDSASCPEAVWKAVELEGVDL